MMNIFRDMSLKISQISNICFIFKKNSNTIATAYGMELAKGYVFSTNLLKVCDTSNITLQLENFTGIFK